MGWVPVDKEVLYTSRLGSTPRQPTLVIVTLIGKD
jgi:hypothetical protein